MNIFLTGEIQVGKSTILNKFLKTHPELSIGGFKTISNFNEEKGVYGGVYIIPASDKEFNFTEDAHIGDKFKNRKGYPEKFDKKGVEILNTHSDFDLILMDEIGFMESKAELFSKSIMNILDGDIPVIGVIKPKNKGLPLMVKQHSKTKVLEVTKNNRDKLYFEFEKLIKRELF